MVSLLSLPPKTTDKLTRLVADNWGVLEKATSEEIIAAFRQIGQLKEFSNYSDAQVWEAVKKKKEGPTNRNLPRPTSRRRNGAYSEPGNCQ